jgi:hypothetical protein
MQDEEFRLYLRHSCRRAGRFLKYRHIPKKISAPEERKSALMGAIVVFHDTYLTRRYDIQFSTKISLVKDYFAAEEMLILQMGSEDTELL